MNTLTQQQQINQYQWLAADGVARVVNLNEKYVFAEADKDYIFEQNQLFEKFDEFVKQQIYQTNAPDDFYSGEAFELVSQSSGVLSKDWRDSRYREDEDSDDWSYQDWADYIEDKYEGNVRTRLFLRLKPSHLPAVLTTQPGEEWKDRYREVWYFTMPTGGTWNEVAIMDNFKSFEDWRNQAIQYNAWATKREWHLNTLPADKKFISGTCDGEKCSICKLPATNKIVQEIAYDDPRPMTHGLSAYVCEYHFNDIMLPYLNRTDGQQAETPIDVLNRTNYIVPADEANCVAETVLHDDVGMVAYAMQEYAKGVTQQLQSTITQKDQRIAELEKENKEMREHLNEIKAHGIIRPWI